MEHRQAKKLFPVIKNQTTYSSLIPLDQYLLWKETKETSWEDGKRKLVGLGWEGGRLGDGITELKTKYLGEGLPDKLLARYEMRHRDIFNCHLPGVDKDKVSESQLRMWVRGLESGAKVVSVPSGRYVSVLSLGPHGVRSSVVVEQREWSGQTSVEASEIGVEVKVNIF